MYVVTLVADHVVRFCPITLLCVFVFDRLWTGLLHLFFWGSLVLYVLFIIVWTFIALFISPSFYFAGIVMFSRCGSSPFVFAVRCFPPTHDDSHTHMCVETPRRRSLPGP